MALLGLTWLALPLTLFPLAQQRIVSSLTGMINGSTPLFVAAVATVLLRRLPGPRQRLGLAIGVVGLFLVALPSLGKGSSSVLGVLLVVAAGPAMASRSTSPRRCSSATAFCPCCGVPKPWRWC